VEVDFRGADVSPCVLATGVGAVRVARCRESVEESDPSLAWVCVRMSVRFEESMCSLLD
jgi:hypothetical protein